MGPKVFFLKKLHGGINVVMTVGSKKFGPRSTRGEPPQRNSCTAADGVFDKIDHALDMVRPNHGPTSVLGSLPGPYA